MTRKDYERLAAAFRRAYINTDHTRLRHYGVTEALDCVADVLAADNPLFDREKFMKAAMPQP